MKAAVAQILSDPSFEKFSIELCSKLDSILSGRITSWDKMWRNFFILCSLREANLPETPVFYQHVTDLIFRGLMKLRCARLAAEGEESRAMSSTELNALRYATGYVCRTITGKLKKSSNQQ